jgi:glycosyltransferase involved in cell wall biosynthesis
LATGERRILIVSGNLFGARSWGSSTARVWDATAVGFDSVHVFARSETQRFEELTQGKVHLHLIPRGHSRMAVFILTSWLLPIYAARIKPTVILAQSAVHGGSAAAFVARRRGIPLMVEMHGEHYLRAGQVGGWWHRVWVRPTARRSLAKATRVRSLSPQMTSEIGSVYGPQILAKVVEIPGRVDLKLFGTPKLDYAADGPGLTLMMVGALNANKNQVGLVHDLAALDVPVTLRLAGEGPDRDEILKRAAGTSVEVELLGLVTQTRLAELLRTSDIYVHYSRSEAVSRAVLEAMAVGLPVVVAPGGFLGGIVIDGATGVCLPSTSPPSLRAALEVLRDAEARQRIGRNARATIERDHEWGTVFDKFLLVLEHIQSE